MHQFLPIVVLFLVIFDQIYRAFSSVYDSTVSSAFLLNIWFVIAIFIHSIIFAIENDQFKAKSITIFYSLLLIIFLNILKLSIFNNGSVINSFIWILKWGTSLGTVCIVLSSIGYIFLVASGFFASKALNKHFLYVNMIVDENLQAFVEKLSAVFQGLITVIALLTAGIAVFMTTVFAYICPLLIGIVLIILPFAVLIGFGSASAPFTMQKIMKMANSTMNLIHKIRTLLPVVLQIAKFAKKATSMSAMISQGLLGVFSPTSLLFIYPNVFAVFLTISGVSVIYFLSLERKGKFGSGQMAIFVVILMLFAVCLMVGLLIIEFLMTKSIDLFIVEIHFIPADAFFWTKGCILSLLVGLAIMLVVYLFGSTEGVNEKDFYSDLDLMSRYSFPGLFPLICPLFDYKKEEHPRRSKCNVISNNILFCCFEDDSDRNSEKKMTQLDSCRKMFCCCFTDNKHYREENHFKRCILDFFCCYDKGDKLICDPLKMCCFWRNCQELRRENDVKTQNTSKELFRGITKKNVDFNDLKSYVQSNETTPQNTQITQIPEVISLKTNNPKNIAMFDFAIFYKISEVFNINFINHLPSYIAPFLAVLAILYYCHQSVRNEWIRLVLGPSKVIAMILGDTSLTASSGAVEDGSKTAGSICGSLDLIPFLMNLIKNLIYSMMGNFFADFEILEEQLEILKILFPDEMVQNPVSFFYRAILLFPAILFCFLLVTGSAFSAIFPFITRLVILPILAGTLFLFLHVLFLPKILQCIFETAPFFMVNIVLSKGFYYAEKAALWMSVAIVILIVDHFLPPVVPKREVDGEEFEAFCVDKELDSFFG